MKKQTEFGLILVLFTQLINISYVDGLDRDFSNMILEVVSDNGSYQTDYNIIDMSPGNWILVNASVPEGANVIVLSNQEGSYSQDSDPSILEITYKPIFKSDFSNLRIQFQSNEKIEDIGYLVISKEDNSWILVGLERPPENGEEIVILADIQTFDNEVQEDIRENNQIENESITEENIETIFPTSEENIEILEETNVTQEIVENPLLDNQSVADTSFDEDKLFIKEQEISTDSDIIQIFDSKNKPKKLFKASAISEFSKTDVTTINYSFTPKKTDSNGRNMSFPLNKIEFKNLDPRGGGLGLEYIPGDKTPFGKNSRKSFAIDPSELIFDQAEVTITAQGNELFKCAEWNFENQLCLGDWVKVMDLVPGEDYILIINATDPAYVEFSSYNSTFGTPVCDQFAQTCKITGDQIRSTTNYNVPEPNGPNTIDACIDGTATGTFGADESVDEITIFSPNTFLNGTRIYVNSSFTCYNNGDVLSLFYANNSSSQNWKLINSTNCQASGKQNWSNNFVIDNVTGNHVIRVVNSYGSAPTLPNSCGATANPTYSDTDDVVFGVHGTILGCVDLNNPATFPGRLIQYGTNSYYVTSDFTLCTNNYTTKSPNAVFYDNGEYYINFNNSRIIGNGLGTGIIQNGYEGAIRNGIFEDFKSGVQYIKQDNTLPTPISFISQISVEDDYIRDMTFDRDGNYISVGRALINGDITAFIRKTDSNNSVIWNTFFNRSVSVDDLAGVTVDSSNNIIAVGKSRNDTTSLFDYLIVKYDSNGIQQWNRTFNITGVTSSLDLIDVAVDLNGKYVFSGLAPTTGNNGLIGTIEDDGTDILYSIININTTGNDFANGIAIDQYGYYIVAGYTQNGSDQDYFISKYDSGLNRIWLKSEKLSDSFEYIYEIEIDRYNDYILVGTTNVSGNYDSLIIKIGEDGSRIWNYTFPFSGSNLDQIFFVDTNQINNYFVGGYLQNSGHDDTFMAIISANGLLLDNNTQLVPSSNEYLYGGFVDSEGNYIGFGKSSSESLILKSISNKQELSDHSVTNISIFDPYNLGSTFFSGTNSYVSANNLSVGYKKDGGYIKLSRPINGTIKSADFSYGNNFVSINPAKVGNFNLDSNISLNANCSSTIQYYKAPGFPQSKDQIILQGTKYTPSSSSCTNNITTFATNGGFSGYAISSTSVTGCSFINYPGNYTQIANLTGAPLSHNLSYGSIVNACIVINSSNVSYNCNKNSIVGLLSDNGIIVASNKNNITIQNCNISNYDYGVWLDVGVNRSIINNIFSFGYGVYSYYSNHSSMIGNNVSNGVGFNMYQSNWQLVENNTVNSNSIVCLNSNQNQNITVNNNTFRNCPGLVFADVRDILISNNKIHNSSSGALALGTSTNNRTRVINNTINGTGGYGININNPNALVENNTIFNASSSGITVSGFLYNVTLINNTLNNTAGMIFETLNGIAANNKIFNSSSTAFNAYASNNSKIENNTIMYSSSVCANLNQLRNISFKNNTIANCSANIVIIENSNVTNNSVTNSPTIGINVYGATNLNFTNNILKKSPTAAYFSSSQYVTISNNTLGDCSSDGLNIQSSNNITVSNNTIQNNSGNDLIYLYLSNNTKILNNNLTNSTLDGGLTVQNVINATIIGNNLHSIKLYAFWILNSQNINSTNNTIHSSGRNFEIQNSTVTGTNNRLFNSSEHDFQIFSGNGSINMNFIFDNPQGNLENYTNITIIDNLESNERYRINWSNQPALLSNIASFRNKWVNISEINPSIIDEIYFHWNDSEAIGFQESLFEIYSYNGSWNDRNGNSNLPQNSLSLYSLDQFGTFGIVVDDNCPTISSEGLFTQTKDYHGGNVVCVGITSSNVIFDCNGYSIIGDGLTDYGIYLDGVSNVTIQNCNISNYTNAGISSYNSNQNIFKNITLFKNGDGIKTGLESYFNNYTNITSYNNTNNGITIERPNNNFNNTTVFGNNQDGYYCGSEVSGANIFNSRIYFNKNNGIFLNYCGYSSINNNTIYNNNGSGLLISNSAYTNITNNNISRSGNESAIEKSGVYIYSSPYSRIINNTVAHSFSYGLAIESSDINLSSNNLTNNSLFVTNTNNFAPMLFNMTNTVFLNPLGTTVNLTNLSIHDNLPNASMGAYGFTVNWARNASRLSGVLLASRSFREMWIDINEFGNTPTLDRVIWHWTNAQSSGYNESKLEVWKYDTQWVDIKSIFSVVRNDGANTITVSNLNNFSNFGVLEVTNNCPIINTPGNYVQNNSFIGAPNNVSDLIYSSTACVVINSSNVNYNCNDFTIIGNGINQVGIISNKTNNVTIRNCPGISNYYYGVVAYNSTNTTFNNLTSYNISQDAFYIDFGSNAFINNSIANSSNRGINIYRANNINFTNIRFFNLTEGYNIYESNNTRIENNSLENVSTTSIGVYNTNNNYFKNISINKTNTGINIYEGNNNTIHNISIINQQGGNYGVYINGQYNSINEVYVRNSPMSFNLQNSNYTNLTNLKTENITSNNIRIIGASNIKLENLTFSSSNGSNEIYIDTGSNASISKVFANYTDGHVIYVTNYNNSNISNFNVTNSNGSAIYGYYVNRMNITNLTYDDNNNQSFVSGVYTSNSNNIRVQNVYIENVFDGIALESSANNSFIQNATIINATTNRAVAASNGENLTILDINISNAYFGAWIVNVKNYSLNNIRVNTTNNSVLFIPNSDNANITNIIVYNGTYDTGITLHALSSSNIKFENISINVSNGYDSIAVTDGQNATFKNINMTNLTGYFVYLYNMSNVILTNLIGDRLNSHGVFAETGRNINLSNVSFNATGSNSQLLYLSNINDSKIENIIAKNAFDGIAFYYGRNALIRNASVPNGPANRGISFTNYQNGTVQDANVSGAYYNLWFSNSNVSLKNVRVFNSTWVDLYSTDPINYNFSGLLIDNPLGTMQNMTNISLNQSTAVSHSFIINWTNLSSTLPPYYGSFENKWINITNTSPGISITSVVWNWNDSEAALHNENKLELWRFNSSWLLLNNTPNTVSNHLSTQSLNTFGVFGILEKLNVNCPIVNESDVPVNRQFVQQISFNGTPNNISSDLSGYTACVVINADNFIYDCNSSRIENASPTSTVGVFLNRTQNVTLRNCPGIRSHAFGVYVDGSNNSSIINSSINSTTNSININSSSNLTIRNNTIISQATGIMTNFVNSTNITNNTFNISLHGIFIDGITSRINISNNWIQNPSSTLNEFGILIATDLNSSTIRNNNILGGDSGIVVSNTSSHQPTSINNSVIQDNYIRNMIGTAINLRNTTRSNITNNVLVNASIGIRIFNSSNNNITFNSITNNTQNGFAINGNTNNYSSNYVCNNTFDVNNTGTNLSGVQNSCDEFSNWQEDGRLGCTFTCSSMWARFFGNVAGTIILKANNSANVYNWSNAQGFNIYVADVDSVISFSSLRAIGRTTSGALSSNDFIELDSDFATTSFGDSINRTYSTDGSLPVQTSNFSVYGTAVNNVPIARSNAFNSNFNTGIMWDSSDGGTQYNGSQTTVWAVKVSQNILDSYGVYDYLIQVPQTLATQEGSNNQIVLYYELQ